MGDAAPRPVQGGRDTAPSAAETFAFLSDFSTTEERDPGVVGAERLGGGPVGEGTEFRVVAELLGRKAALTYVLVEFDPGGAVTLRGENATVVTSGPTTCAHRTRSSSPRSGASSKRSSTNGCRGWSTCRTRRPGASSPAARTDARARTITVYTDVGQAVRELRLPGTDAARRVARGLNP